MLSASANKMKKRIVILVLSFLLGNFLIAYADDSPKIRALSLKVLQKESIRSCKTNGSCPEVISKMAGLTKITGYIIDKKNRDIILIGEHAPDSSPILLEDFAVALRNAWLKYAVVKGRTQYYSDPGCSIDPDPLTIKKLKSVNNTNYEEALREWERICRAPQNVRVLGVPFDSHFAFIMVKADYDMKRIVNGSDPLEIKDFSSLMDRRLEIYKQEASRKTNVGESDSSMNRFWFFPGENKYSEDAGVVHIERSKVILLTEEEFMDHQGVIVGKKRPDPLAREFCESFSENYSEIAVKRPIYSELENLFRLVALAKTMKLKSADHEAGLKLTYFLERYRIPHHPVKRQLPGLFCVKRYQYREKVSDGYRVYNSALQSCGGVGINIRVSKKQFIKDKSGGLKKVRAAALNKRPSQSTLYWNISDQPTGKEKSNQDLPARK